KFLGLSVGVILHHMTPEERREMYSCDITYATNNELGFDYLRDNMVVKKEQMVLRGLHYAVIDEIDSILIDEARTPLIISGSGTKSTQLYLIADYFAKTLQKGRLVNETEAMNAIIREELIEEGDFVVDEKAKSVVLTQQGVKKAEAFFKLENLSDPNNLEVLHHINNALKANYNMSRDKDYVVQNGEVMIVDEFTGRIMPGRRYSDGLHQAIEAKEKVQVKKESKTLASVTFQNFFNKYEKKAGMTGTAQTEETEFRNIYNMDVVVVPTNLPVTRKDLNDVVYKTEKAKFRAVIKEVEAAYAKGQPVLVGTVNIDKSEELSRLLKAKGIPHNVLNAKYHEQEAQIIAQAGQLKAVTIATNMAGRGTDIKLGEGVKEVGGLKIVGTERHESRRIDNQLRGRSGRQGDPGESRFYISLEDDLMRLFGGEKTIKMIDSLGIEEDDPIEHGMLTKAIENAQKKVEGNNFAIRKHLLEYDEVMNEQREIIYGERKRVLFGEDIRESIMGMIDGVIENIAERTLGESENCDDWNLMEFCKSLHPVIPIGLVRIREEDKAEMTKEKFIEGVTSACKSLYKLKEREIATVLPHREGEEPKMREIERVVMLKIIDSRWMEHIDNMDRMRQSVSLQTVAQRDPLVEYKINSYDMFNDLSYVIQLETVKSLFHAKVAKQQMPQRESVLEPKQ
ncbi:MAG: preprotein translocase subunit SecA, partial [Firmicutes bacterium]|nr:preprotein translocase subunit SecA [Bacillota bacterium]